MKIDHGLKEKEIILRAKQDPKYKNILLETYYPNACKWAKKFLDKIIFTDLVSPSQEEINSLVYMAFEKAVEKINPEKDNSMSFKNFFYLMIKYQCYYELKNCLRPGIIESFQEEKKKFIFEQSRNLHVERDYIHSINSSLKTQEILNFLSLKKECYRQIIELKMYGYSNKEICENLDITPVSLKAKVQYIRKLIREHFSDFAETF